MVNKEELFSNLNRGMLQERGALFKINLEKNLPLIKKHGGLLPVIERLKGKDVIVIGAGPGLDRDIPLLRKYMDRIDVVYIAADMALKPLLSRGVKPHFVITCETKPYGFFSGTDTRGIKLLAFSCSSSGNLRQWEGDYCFYNWMVHDDFYSELWQTAGEDLGFVATGSIVLTQAVSIALGCGISTLVLAGNDLGFSDRYYVSGSAGAESGYNSIYRLKTGATIEMDAVRRSRDYEIIRGGRVVYTNNQFLAARLWLEDLFKSTSCQVFDASYPGCADGSVKKITLEEYFAMKYSIRKKRR